MGFGSLSKEVERPTLGGECSKIRHSLHNT